MKRLIRMLGAGTVGVALIAASPTAASAAVSVTRCTHQLAPGTYGQVVVPQGATCQSDGPVFIRGGLYVRPGATFVLGSEENPVSTGTIANGVHAQDAMSVQIHFANITGGVSIQGGSGPFGGPFQVTWNTIEDSAIQGNVTMSGYNGFWMGFIRNRVAGTVNLNNNVLADPDGNEYVTNLISGDLHCSGDSPAPQIGDSDGQPNMVGGAATGQCRGLGT